MPTFSEIYTKNAQKYEDWITKVDQILTEKVGVGIEDLPDATWYDYHEDGLSPLESIEEANDEFWDGALSFALR